MQVGSLEARVQGVGFSLEGLGCWGYRCYFLLAAWFKHHSAVIFSALEVGKELLACLLDQWATSANRCGNSRSANAHVQKKCPTEMC